MMRCYVHAFPTGKHPSLEKELRCMLPAVLALAKWLIYDYQTTGPWHSTYRRTVAMLLVDYSDAYDLYCTVATLAR